MLKTCLDKLSRQARCAIEAAKCERVVAKEVVNCFSSSPEFAGIVAQLTCDDVVGCIGDEDASLEKEAEGVNALEKKQYAAAAKLFSEALRHTDERTQKGRERSASLYARRAECMLHQHRFTQAVRCHFVFATTTPFFFPLLFCGLHACCLFYCTADNLFSFSTMRNGNCLRSNE